MANEIKFPFQAVLIKTPRSEMFYATECKATLTWRAASQPASASYQACSWRGRGLFCVLAQQQTPPPTHTHSL